MKHPFVFDDNQKVFHSIQAQKREIRTALLTIIHIMCINFFRLTGQANGIEISLCSLTFICHSGERCIGNTC